MSRYFRLTTVAVALLVGNLLATGWDVWLVPVPQAAESEGPRGPAEELTDVALDELFCHASGGLRPVVVEAAGFHAAPEPLLYALSTASELLRPPRV
jgi:hypothetical protein